MDKRVIFAVAGSSVVSLAVGSIAGYFFAKRQLTEEFEEQLTEEVSATKDFYSRMHKKDFATPAEAARALIPEEPSEETLRRVLTGLKYTADGTPAHIAAIRGDVDLEPASIFDGTETEFDLDAEVAARTSEAPYILLRDEFMNNERDFTQDTLTYFRADKVLIDAADQPVPDVDDLVGEGNLLRFGYLSGDQRVLYVRNEQKELEFEILLSDRAYTEEVLGLGV